MKIVIDNNKSFEPGSNYKAPYGTQLHIMQDQDAFFLYLQTCKDENQPTWEFCGYYLNTLFEKRAINNYIKKKLNPDADVES